MTIEPYGLLARARFYLVGRKGEPLADPSSLLGVAPDSVVRIGRPKAPGMPLPNRDLWILEERESPASGDEFATGIERCLDRLLARLEAIGAGEKLRSAGLADFAKITLGGFCSDLRDANIEHTPERLNRMAKLGLPIEEDFYELAE